MKKVLRSEAQKTLQNMLRDARKNADLTQEKLASVLEKPQSFVAKYEGGERLLNAIELIYVLKAMGVKPGEFIEKLDRAIDL